MAVGRSGTSQILSILRMRCLPAAASKSSTGVHNAAGMYFFFLTGRGFYLHAVGGERLRHELDSLNHRALRGRETQHSATAAARLETMTPQEPRPLDIQSDGRPLALRVALICLEKNVAFPCLRACSSVGGVQTESARIGITISRRANPNLFNTCACHTRLPADGHGSSLKRRQNGVRPAWRDGAASTVCKRAWKFGGRVSGL